MELLTIRVNWKQYIATQELGRFKFFSREADDELKCERLVKYNGKKIEIAGLQIGGFQLGKLNIEPKLLQAVSHALMLLDASQYDLCRTIKGIKDKKKREEYLNIMMQDKLHSQQINRGIAALTLNPESKPLQEALKNLLLSHKSRVLEIDSTDISEKTITSDQLSENALEVPKKSFQDSFQDYQEMC